MFNSQTSINQKLVVRPKGRQLEPLQARPVRRAVAVKDLKRIHLKKLPHYPVRKDLINSEDGVRKQGSKQNCKQIKQRQSSIKLKNKSSSRSSDDLNSQINQLKAQVDHLIKVNNKLKRDTEYTNIQQLQITRENCLQQIKRLKTLLQSQAMKQDQCKQRLLQGQKYSQKLQRMKQQLKQRDQTILALQERCARGECRMGPESLAERQTRLKKIIKYRLMAHGLTKEEAVQHICRTDDKALLRRQVELKLSASPFQLLPLQIAVTFEGLPTLNEERLDEGQLRGRLQGLFDSGPAIAQQVFRSLALKLLPAEEKLRDQLRIKQSSPGLVSQQNFRQALTDQGMQPEEVELAVAEASLICSGLEQVDYGAVFERIGQQFQLEDNQL